VRPGGIEREGTEGGESGAQAWRREVFGYAKADEATVWDPPYAPVVKVGKIDAAVHEKA
jgi:hypothetical protein